MTTVIEQGQKDAKITLHWLEQSRSHRILWALEETGAPYELKTYKRGKDMLADPELKKVHPLGKSPVVSIDVEGAETRVLAESGFITEYLLDYYGKEFVPDRYQAGKEGRIGGETTEWLKYRTWMHYAEGSLMTILLLAFVVQNIENAPVPFFLKPIPRAVARQINKQFLSRQIDLHFDFIENELKTSGGDFLCGNKLTGADFMMEFPLQMAGHRAGADAAKYPLIKAYLERLHERDAYKRAVQKVVDTHGEFNMKLG